MLKDKSMPTHTYSLAHSQILTYSEGDRHSNTHTHTLTEMWVSCNRFIIPFGKWELHCVSGRPTNRPKRYRYESERHDNDKRRTKRMANGIEQRQRATSTKGICGVLALWILDSVSCDKRMSFFIHWSLAFRCAVLISFVIFSLFDTVLHTAFHFIHFAPYVKVSRQSAQFNKQKN